jgi:glycosyltransferase involved in cell wall biosynthesis
MTEISVVIPAYNRQWSVTRAVQSVLTQTYQDFEIIVVDDGSTDGTAAAVEAISQAEPRVRLLRLEGQGGAQAARNAGVQASQGLYIALLDSDDEWLPDKLEKQMSLFLEGGPELGTVTCGYIRVYESGNPSTEELIEVPRQAYKALLNRYGLGPTSVMVIRKSALVQAGMFNERARTWQEWDMSIRLAGVAEVAVVPESLVLYHIHNSEAISKDLLKGAQGYLDVLLTYKSAILEQCGPEVLATQYAEAAQQFLGAGSIVMARKCYLSAIRVTPLNLKLLLRWASSMTGGRGYRAFSSFRGLFRQS